MPNAQCVGWYAVLRWPPVSDGSRTKLELSSLYFQLFSVIFYWVSWSKFGFHHAILEIDIHTNGWPNASVSTHFKQIWYATAGLDLSKHPFVFFRLWRSQFMQGNAVRSLCMRLRSSKRVERWMSQRKAGQAWLPHQQSHLYIETRYESIKNPFTHYICASSPSETIPMRVSNLSNLNSNWHRNAFPVPLMKVAHAHQRSTNMYTRES